MYFKNQNAICLFLKIAFFGGRGLAVGKDFLFKILFSFCRTSGLVLTSELCCPHEVHESTFLWSGLSFSCWTWFLWPGLCPQTRPGHALWRLSCGKGFGLGSYLQAVKRLSLVNVGGTPGSFVARPLDWPCEGCCALV